MTKAGNSIGLFTGTTIVCRVPEALQLPCTTNWKLLERKICYVSGMPTILKSLHLLRCHTIAICPDMLHPNQEHRYVRHRSGKKSNVHGTRKNTRTVRVPAMLPKESLHTMRLRKRCKAITWKLTSVTDTDIEPVETLVF